jgi:NADH:ubiquinone oxidoreductase subunit E/NAD-dependent dihydropyrimidine dehydrogenase PreA subunit
MKSKTVSPVLPRKNANGASNGGGNGNGNGRQPCGAVMVCGGGVAGIQASLDLSAAGFRVYLVEESPTIGGGMARLDKTFPTGDCATCIISPKLVECMRDYNIDVMTMADVVRLDGEAGNFKVEIRKRPRGVDSTKCTGCGDCWTVCPVRNTAQDTPPFVPSAPLNEADAARIEEILKRHEGEAGAVMPVLQEVNQSYGYIPRGILEHLASLWQMRLAEIMRVASFYDRFHLAPSGRHVIEVCRGTSCHARGSRLLLEKLKRHLGVEEDQTDKTGRFTLRTVRCLGLCALSPSIKIGGRNFGRVNMDKIGEILEQFA